MNIQTLGYITILLCTICFFIHISHYFKFKRRNKEVARVFLADATILFATMMFGTATAIGANIDNFLYPLRIAALALVIIYSWLLLKADRENDKIL